MNQSARTSPPDNPFATRWVRPGVVPYRFAAGETAESLVERLRASQWWGQITGPHGSGKSTLLATLLPALEAAGRQPISVALHDGQRRLPAEFADSSTWNRQTQIVVDGYEQLGRLSRAMLRRRVRRAGGGLLVTAHASLGLTQLAHIAPDQDTVIQVVGNLLGGTWDMIRPEDVTARFAVRDGDVRELLFDLYDIYEERRRQI